MKLQGAPNRNTATALERLLEKSEEALQTIEELKKAAVDDAVAKDALARKKADALKKYQNAGKSQELREAHADHEFAEERLESLKASGKKEALVEQVRTERQFLSALQTYINSETSVAKLLKYGQEHTP